MSTDTNIIAPLPPDNAEDKSRRFQKRLKLEKIEPASPITPRPVIARTPPHLPNPDIASILRLVEQNRASILRLEDQNREMNDVLGKYINPLITRLNLIHRDIEELRRKVDLPYTKL